MESTLFEPAVTNGKALSHGNFEATNAGNVNMQLAPIDTPRATSMMEVIGRAAQDPSVDVGKMQELLSMQKELMAIEAEQAFNAALSEMQPKFPAITKRGSVAYDNTKYKFAKYEHIDMAIRPILAEHGFSLSFSQDKDVYTCTLSHKFGHSRSANMQLAPDKSGKKNDIQAIGSATSYAKRYLVGMLLNIVTVDEDDDAVGACSIDGVEIANLKSLMERAKPLDEAKFLEFMQVTRLELIQKRDYRKAEQMLNSKIKANLNAQKHAQ